MKARRRPAFGTLFAALALTSCSSNSVAAIPSGYEIGDATTETSLTLLVPGGVGDEIAEAKVTEQNQERVQVQVSLHQGNTNRPGLEVTLQAQILLSAPLGERTVVDQNGNEIPRRRN